MTDKTEAMDLAKTLDELNKAATQGEWGIWREPISSRHDAIAELTEQVAATKSISDALVLLDAGGLCPASTGCGPTSDANAEFITALVNLYRTGKLIVVPDDAVERMARALAPRLEGGREFDQMPADRRELKIWSRNGMALINDATQDDAHEAATAALAALKGADHAG